MSEFDASAVDVSYDESSYAYDDSGNMVVETTHVDATAYDVNGDGQADYVEADGHQEVYAQDSDGNWAYQQTDVELEAY